MNIEELKNTIGKREIEFRAWDGKFMINWNLLFSFKSVCGLFDNSNIQLMQYTGLKDKNGKKIFEGDIVGWYRDKSAKRGWLVGVVTFDVDDSSWGVSYDDGEGNNGFVGVRRRLPSCYHEVIGNIFENPELLTAE